MNPSAILALISDLYAQIVQLKEQNDLLRRALASPNESANGQTNTPEVAHEVRPA